MRSKSSFQGMVRFIAISLGIILIVGGCSSSDAGKEIAEEATVVEEETEAVKENSASEAASPEPDSKDQSTTGISGMTTGEDAALEDFLLDPSDKDWYLGMGEWSEGWIGNSQAAHNVKLRFYSTGDGRQYAYGGITLPDVKSTGICLVR